MVQLKVRARAVDMLGRQQIAGIPTAIHELLKNAHDAYAERAELDFMRRIRTLVLRDDGYGMTREDVENKWLTLGTENRLAANREQDISHWTGPKNLPRRTIMGEKGIGRLAIAVIAPITLLMTRAVRPDGKPHDLVVALVHWGLFEQPGLDVTQIDVPVREFSDGTLPTGLDFDALVAHVLNNLKDLRSFLENSEYVRIKRELESISIKPDQHDMRLNDNSDNPLSLSGTGYGTHFYMLPTYHELADDIDSHSDGGASQLEQSLLGFSNTMAVAEPVLSTAFKDHKVDGSMNELLSEGAFFHPKELTEDMDHWVDGQFDEFGQFTGRIKIYDNEPRPFVANWPDGKGRRTRCGPFQVKFGYLMGNDYESLVDPAKYKTKANRLERIGGLYVYKDGIRILPYGGPDYDFLEIEKRRTKSAQDWFFSYRRLIGFAAISHDLNEDLSEKAGREGFRQNFAYRDFRAILMNLFQRLAYEFFRPTSPQQEFFWEKKKEFEALEKARKRQKKKAGEKRAELKEALSVFFAANSNGEFRSRAKQICADTADQIAECKGHSNAQVVAEELLNIETKAFQRINVIENEITITKPRGLALNSRLAKDWLAYQRIARELKQDPIDTTRRRLSDLFSQKGLPKVDAIKHHQQILGALSSDREKLVKSIVSLRQQAYAAAEEMQRALRNTVKKEINEFIAAIDGSIADFTRAVAEHPEEIEDRRGEIDRKFIEMKSAEVSFLDSLRRNLEDLTEDLHEGQTPDDRIEALEQQLLGVEEKLEFYQDFAQIGMSVGILQHEFEKSAKEMRRVMRNLKPWADGTPGLKNIYLQLRDSFDHLDGYLGMLDPLGRRLNRFKVEISGDQIRVYLMRVFGARLEAAHIKLNASDDFIEKTVKCYSSTILGAFVNVVDNAIYWVDAGAKTERQIDLGADDFGYLISNTGPGIDERYSESIFDFGESHKPSGRGMGLAISREDLRREGFDLELLQAGMDVQPVFRITTISKGEELGE